MPQTDEARYGLARVSRTVGPIAVTFAALCLPQRPRKCVEEGGSCSLSIQLPAPEPLLTRSASGPIQTYQLQPAGGREERAVYKPTLESSVGRVQLHGSCWGERTAFPNKHPVTAHGHRFHEIVTKSSCDIQSLTFFVLVIL